MVVVEAEVVVVVEDEVVVVEEEVVETVVVEVDSIEEDLVEVVDLTKATLLALALLLPIKSLSLMNRENNFLGF